MSKDVITNCNLFLSIINLNEGW